MSYAMIYLVDSTELAVYQSLKDGKLVDFQVIQTMDVDYIKIDERCLGNLIYRLAPEWWQMPKLKKAMKLKFKKEL